jgi:uncharacterized protein YcgI (DUF1989 family)
MSEVTVLPARTGVAVRLPSGATIEVGNPSGTQVVDFWALSGADYLSVAHTRGALGRLVPRVGDTLVSNLREPLLTLVEDTSPGVHDTLIAACDPARYRQLGAPGHANCADNFAAALRELGLAPVPVPNPLNLFMNVPWTADGSVTFAPPRSRPGDRVRLRAERDLVVVMSACPQDLVPVNGEDQQTRDAAYRVLPA